MITETAQTHLTEIRRHVHTDCFVCSRENEQGLHLKFHVVDDGEVKADFIFNEDFAGYSGMLHGGIISAVLDGAMTNCLFAQGCTAVTADFRVRFRHQVITEQMAGVRAWITRSTPPIYELKAEITQNHQVKIIATGKLMELIQLRGNSNL